MEQTFANRSSNSKETLAILLSRQWTIESATTIHVLSRLSFRDRSNAADISTGYRLSLSGVKTNRNSHHLHHLQLILVHLNFLPILRLLLLLLFLCNSVYKVRHHFLRVFVVVIH